MQEDASSQTLGDEKAVADFEAIDRQKRSLGETINRETNEKLGRGGRVSTSTL